MLKLLGLTLCVVLATLTAVEADGLVGVSPHVAVGSSHFWVNVPGVGHVETNRFAWKQHTLYGWSLDVIIPPGVTGRWHTVYQYPAPAEFLMNPANVPGKVSENFTRVTEEPKPFTAEDKMLQGLCLLMPGEPAGKYQISIFISLGYGSDETYKRDQNVLAHTFNYEISEEPKPKQ